MKELFTQLYNSAELFSESRLMYRAERDQPIDLFNTPPANPPENNPSDDELIILPGDAPRQAKQTKQAGQKVNTGFSPEFTAELEDFLSSSDTPTTPTRRVNLSQSGEKLIQSTYWDQATNEKWMIAADSAYDKVRNNPTKLAHLVNDHLDVMRSALKDMVRGNKIEKLVDKISKKMAAKESNGEVTEASYTYAYIADAKLSYLASNRNTNLKQNSPDKNYQILDQMIDQGLV